MNAFCGDCTLQLQLRRNCDSSAAQLKPCSYKLQCTTQLNSTEQASYEEGTISVRLPRDDLYGLPFWMSGLERDCQTCSVLDYRSICVMTTKARAVRQPSWQWHNSFRGVTRVFGAPGQNQRSAPPLQSRDVGRTPTVRFSVKGTLWLHELSFFCKVTTRKFTAKLHHINT